MAAVENYADRFDDQDDAAYAENSNASLWIVDLEMPADGFAFLSSFSQEKIVRNYLSATFANDFVSRSAHLKKIRPI